MKKAEQLDVGGTSVPVSNLDKVLYPAVGFTKSDVINYYIRISPVMLPHLKDRPVTLKRYPEGTDAEFFYEKRCPPYRPKWIKTISVWSEHKKEAIAFCAIDNLPSLVWVANLANLEFHTYLFKRQKLTQPTMMVFDLDPGPPATIVECAEVAVRLRDLFRKRKLQTFAKTSGSKGLQVYVPLNTPVTFDQTKSFAKSVAEFMASEHPDQIVSKMTKSLRTGKVFIDWSQNEEHKTTVCAYSLRGKERPTVSTPVTWDEVEAARKKKALSFEHDEVLGRVKRRGDLFEKVLTLKQRLPAALV